VRQVARASVLLLTMVRDEEIADLSVARRRILAELFGQWDVVQVELGPLSRR
jgi:hypothetical protein